MSERGTLKFYSRTAWSLAFGLVWISCQTVLGQTLATSSGRKLAPDALKIIPPAAEFGETFQGPVDLPLVTEHPELAWDPNYFPKSETLLEMGKNVTFRGPVYCLEFAFKPVRMIELDIPTATGIQRKNVWYLLYRVRYLGGDLQPKSEQDQFNNQVFALPEAVSAKWVRCFPVFTLDAKGLNQRYVDQVVPSVKKAIAIKERVGKPIYDSVEIQRLKIDISTPTEDHAVWGLATWTEVDPRTDFFSVEVRGLTNAQRIESGGNQLKYLQKTLVLNFSRPGDTVNETEDRIRYGVPALEDPARQQYVLQQYGLQERLDHLWIYR